MQARSARHRRTRRVLPGTVVGACVVLMLSACGATAVAGSETTRAAAAPSAPVPVAAILTSVPADGAATVLDDITPMLSVAHGKIVTAALHDPTGREVPGTLGADGTSWHATGPLAAGKQYTFEVTGADDHGYPFANRSSFSTINDDHIVKASVSPLAGMTVGVGQPIAIQFSHPVVDKALVERHLRVDTSTPVVGAWHWESDDVVHYRPQQYWPANTRVVLHTDLKGLNVGGGRFGDQNRTIAFTVGRAQMTIVDVKSHRMQVIRDGKLLRTIRVSTGKKGYLTRGGYKVVLGMEKERHMTGEGIGIKKGAPDYFDLHVKWAVRMTWSGEFLHAAPWQGRNHGRANVSHGCVGMSTSDAEWYYDHSMIGDLVRIDNSPRKMELRNGYGDWNLSWADWIAGSALPHDPVAPGTFAVDPTVPDTSGGASSSNASSSNAPSGEQTGGGAPASDSSTTASPAPDSGSAAHATSSDGTTDSSPSTASPTPTPSSTPTATRRPTANPPGARRPTATPTATRKPTTAR